MKIGSHTSRGGLATSEGGINFIRQSKPVLFPAVDNQQAFEWTGGCEDPRLAEREDGAFVVTYTQYTGPENGRKWRLGLASSTNLMNWIKRGSPFTGTKYESLRMKSAAIVHEIHRGHLVAAKINGKYWMYFGERSAHVATSADLFAWKPVEDVAGKLLEVMVTRPGFFDSGLTEIGPQAVLTSKGIVVFYNGKNNDPKKGGQYAAGTTFGEGLVLFKGKWFLYYG